MQAQQKRGSAVQGLATWMIPPATGWRRKGGRYQRTHLLFPALGLFLVLIGLTVSGVVAAQSSEPQPYLYVLQIGLLLAGMALIVFILNGIQYHLLEPLAHLRNWAQRMRGGNLSARIPVPDKGEFAELARDINELSDSLKLLSQDMDSQVRKQTERIAQKTRSLQILYDVAASLNVSRDLKDLLTRFLHTMRDIVHAKAGTVRMLNDDDEMELVASIGLDPEVVERERRVPVKRCLCGNAVSGGEVLYQDDISRCSEFIGQPILNGEDVEMIAVPLQHHGRNLGVYNLFVEKPGLVAREDVKDLLTSIGRHLGMAIEKARLDNEAKRLSIMQERTTLAHELHDSLAQTLASLRFQVSMLDETLTHEGEEAAREEFHQIKNGLDEAYTELRELLAHFRAPIDARGLLPALEDLIKRFQEQSGIHTFLQKEWDSSRLSAAMDMQILRIVQEALNNIRKHAQAHTVRVLIRCDEEGEYRVLIEDDGVGMQQPAFSGHPGEHIGLSIMQERARRLNGRLSIESEPSEGTRVTLTFQYPEDEQPPSARNQRVIPLVEENPQ